MMPQMGQVPDQPPDPGDPGELAARARAALGDLERSKEALLRRSASGDGSARVLLAAMVVLRDFAAKTEAAWFAATVGAERELLELARENARLRADLEESRQRQPARRRHAAERPLWPRAVRGAAPLAVLPVGLRHAGSLLGHHAAATALAGTAVAAGAVLAVGAGVTQTVPYGTPAPASHAAFRAPAAAPYSAVRIAGGASSSPSGPRTAAQSASPVPSAVPRSRVSSPPAAPSPSPSPAVTAAVPALTVPRLLDLGATTRGPLTLRAGGDAVTWTLRATDGITVSAAGVPVTGGTLAAGQELDLAVSAPTGAGVVYVSAGSRTWAVVVSSDLAPAGPPPVP